MVCHEVLIGEALEATLAHARKYRRVVSSSLATVVQEQGTSSSLAATVTPLNSIAIDDYTILDVSMLRTVTNSELQNLSFVGAVYNGGDAYIIRSFKDNISLVLLPHHTILPTLDLAFSFPLGDWLHCCDRQSLLAGRSCCGPWRCSIFSILALLLASRIAAFSLFSSNMSRFSSRASSFWV
ncbi:hypothetical protein Tco_1403726 [Tanacetum coccineum]